MYYSPIITSSTTSIDATDNNTITWSTSSSASESQIAYRVLIYLNSNNSVVLDTGQVVSTDEEYEITGGTLSNNSLYKVQIWSYYTLADYTKSNWLLLKCEETATLTLSATPTSSQSYNFVWTYNQTNDIKLKYFTANLFLTSDLTTAIDTSDIQYPDTLVGDGDTISYQFNGMESGTSYTVEAIGVTQYDQTINSSQDSFTVTYTYPDNITNLIVTPNNDEGYIELSWTNMVQIIGQLNESPDYVAGKFNYGLHISDDKEIYYLQTVPEGFSFVGWFKLTAGFYGNVMKMINNTTGDYLRIFYDGTSFGFGYSNGYITKGMDASSLIGSWVILGLKKGSLFVVGSGYEETINFN